LANFSANFTLTPRDNSFERESFTRLIQDEEVAIVVVVMEKCDWFLCHIGIPKIAYKYTSLVLLSWKLGSTVFFFAHDRV
jgi:hypothetical protein